MSDNIDVFEEHGGVLYTKVGRAEITFFGNQVSTSNNRVVIHPTKVEFQVSQEEKEMFESLAKPVTVKTLASRAKSVINEIAFSRDFDRVDQLKNLKLELQKLIKQIQ